MDGSTNSVQAKSWAGDIWVKYIMTTQKSQSWKKISKGSYGSQPGNLHILLEIQQRASGWGVTYVIYT